MLCFINIIGLICHGNLQSPLRLVSENTSRHRKKSTMSKVLWDLWPPVACWCLSLSCPHLSLYPSLTLIDFAPKLTGIHGAIFPPELPRLKILVTPLALPTSLTFCSQMADKLC